GWSWSFKSAGLFCNFSYSDSVAGILPSGSPAYNIALAFASSINGHSHLTATAIKTADSTIAYLKICTTCVASSVVLKVNGCWVDHLSCSFNPDISEIVDPDAVDTDCNTNGVADYVDIILGTSSGAVLYVDPRPALNIAQAGANVGLSWSAVGYHLQASPALNNPASWTNVVGASTVTVPISTAPRYFRLQQDD